ncbi:MAG TPA: ABC transporter substrate-binding protein [Verrucomicrobiae bacterium]|nr:ABC transporter substrate-binding protein [Verrucomicrobiae bacterium]
MRVKILFCFLIIFGMFAKVEARTVNVAVPTLSMVVIAFTAAKEKGYYQEEGLDVNLVVMRDTLGISALIGGNADFASMSGAGFTAILGGMPLRFVFSSFFRPMFWLYAKPEFQDIKALKGKRIGVTGLGSGPDNLLRETLKRNGMEGGRDATILALGLPSTVATALRAGTVDAGTISPPFNFMVKEAGFRELVSYLKEDFVELQGSILVNDKLFQSDPALVEKFVRGTLKGLRYARENKAATIAILLRYMKLKEDLAGQYYDQVRPIMTTDGTVSVELQKKYLDQALKILAPKEFPTVERIYNYSLARKINAELDAAGWKPGR